MADESVGQVVWSTERQHSDNSQRANTDSNSNANADTNADCDTDSHFNTNRDAYANGHRDSDGHTNSITNTDSRNCHDLHRAITSAKRRRGWKRNCHS